MGIAHVEVGNLSTFAHGTQIKFVDVDGVERSGECPGFELETSLNPNEYRRRRELMSEVNKIEQV